MAFNQDQRSGQLARLGAWLAVPRRITLPVLFLVGSGLAHLIWLNVDSVKFFAWVSGITAPFCMLCAAAVWAMRDKADLAFLSDSLSAEEYKNASKLESQLRSRSTALAARTCIAASLASTAAVSNQLIGPVWHWMVLAGGAAAGYSVYAYLIAEHWDWQLRAHQSQEIYKRKRAEERAQLIADIERGAVPTDSTSLLPSWQEGPTLKAVKDAH